MTTQLAKLLLLRLSPKSFSFVERYQSLPRTSLLNHWSSSCHNASRFRCKFSSQSQVSVQHLYHSRVAKLIKAKYWRNTLLEACLPVQRRWQGRNLFWKNVFGLSIATGFLNSPPQYVLAEADQSAKDSNKDSSQGTHDEVQSKFRMWAKKLLVPMMLVMTVVMGWNYPMSLAINIVLILFNTKPTPSSIYLWAEEWRQQNLLENNGFEWLKLGKPLHVEVADYKLLCLAQVTSLNQKMLMIGILGEWWILCSTSSSFKFGPLSVVSPFVF